MLHSGSQLVEGSLDVAALQCGLGLDEVGNLIGLDELLVIHWLSIILAITLRVERVLVLCLNVLLTHVEN